MQALSETVQGALYQRQDKTALLLEAGGAPILLRYAFLVQGTGQVVFPALALDDWGRERKTMALYRWVYEQGQRFPRAEVFGFTRSGHETQIFLRDLEIFFNYPCYAYPRPEAPLSEGVRLDVVFTPAPEPLPAPEPGEVPAEIGWPLRHAAVAWQRAGAATLAEAGWVPFSPPAPA